MTIKALAFINPTDDSAREKNWRVLQEQSKFIDFSDKITVGSISNYGSAIAWAQVYGPMAYYYLRLVSSGGGLFLTSAGSGRIYGIPFSSPSLSGLKSTVYYQHLNAWDENGNPIDQVRLAYNAGVPEIQIAGAFTASPLYISGWFFKDA